MWDPVAALSKPHRLVLYLHYYQGYTTGEIAGIFRGESLYRAFQAGPGKKETEIETGGRWL